MFDIGGAEFFGDIHGTYACTCLFFMHVKHMTVL